MSTENAKAVKAIVKVLNTHWENLDICIDGCAVFIALLEHCTNEKKFLSFIV